MGFTGKTSRALPAKETVLGVDVGEARKAYPFSILKKIKTPFKDKAGSETIEIHFDKKTGDAYALNEKKERIDSIVTYWFVWYSFNEDTGIFKKR